MKVYVNRPLAVCCSLLILLPCALASSAAQVRAQAIKFFTSLPSSTGRDELGNLRPFRHASSNRGRIHRAFWTVNTGHRGVEIEDETGQVVLYSDDKLASRSFGGPESVKVPQVGRPFYRSERQLVQRATVILDQIGWHHGPVVEHRPLPSPTSNGKIRRSVIYLTFSDRINGFEVSGGNFSQVGVDSLTGECVELQRQVGYAYAPAGRPLSAQIVGTVVRRTVGLTKTLALQGPRYCQIDVSAQMTGRALRMCEAKQLALSYYVITDRENLLVDALNGEILYRRDNAAADGRSMRHTRATSGLMHWLENLGGTYDPSRPWVIMTGSVAALSAIAGFVVWRHRRNPTSTT